MIAADSHAPQRTMLVRLGQFLQKPWAGKFEVIGFHARRIFQGLPVPLRLPFGAWWLAGTDTLGSALLEEGFENAECRFVQGFLQPGMTVLDIGAHHGLYALLASKRVGPHGHVYAFEPSPRERKKLSLHVRLNLCRNVRLEGFALGEQAGEAQFFVVEGRETGCNSLRPPAVRESTKLLEVQVSRLDDFLRRRHIERVDFIKMDVEGAELTVLKGAGQLLDRPPRPVILAEVYDIRTKPWGYRAREIVAFLQQRGYRWFGIDGQGELNPVDLEREQFDDNFVAVPEERMGEIGHLTKADGNWACQLSE